MRVPILYLDTSVIGGYFDDEFKDHTRELWQQMKQKKYRFTTSLVTIDELSASPAQVRKLLEQTFTAEMIFEITEEMERLAAAYMAQAVLTPKYSDDARHVAVCTVLQIDYLVSWNFRHLCNSKREKGFNAVNLLHGYQTIRIVSPVELVNICTKSGRENHLTR